MPSFVFVIKFLISFELIHSLIKIRLTIKLCFKDCFLALIEIYSVDRESRVFLIFYQLDSHRYL